MASVSSRRGEARRGVHDVAHAVRLDCRRERIAIAHVAGREDDGAGMRIRHAPRHVVQRRMVQGENAATVTGQLDHQVEADEPGAAGDGHDLGSDTTPPAAKLAASSDTSDGRAHAPAASRICSIGARSDMRTCRSPSSPNIVPGTSGPGRPEQTQAELGRRFPRRGDVDVDVERAVRPHVRQAHLVQGLHQEGAAFRVDVAHLRDAVLGPFSAARAAAWETAGVQMVSVCLTSMIGRMKSAGPAR